MPTTSAAFASLRPDVSQIITAAKAALPEVHQVHVHGVLLRGSSGVGMPFDLYSSGDYQWRKEMHASHGDFVEISKRDGHVFGTPDGRKRVTSARAEDFDLLPSASTIRRLLGNTKEAVLVGIENQYGESVYHVRLGAGLVPVDKVTSAESRREQLAPGRNFDLYFSSRSFRLLGAKYYLPVYAAPDSLPKGCLGEDGNVLSLTEQRAKGAVARCQIALQPHLLPAEVQFQEYKLTTAGLFPSRIIRDVQGAVDTLKVDLIEPISVDDFSDRLGR